MSTITHGEDAAIRVPQRGLSCSFVKQHFVQRFCEPMIFESFRENRREKVTKTEVKKAGSANDDENETPKPPFLSGQRAEYSKYCRSSGYTLWKVRFVRFVLFLLKSWMSKSLVLLVLKKYNNLGRLNQCFNVKTIMCI